MLHKIETSSWRVPHALAAIGLAGALLVSHASVADAQPVVDPQYVQFTPSPDHSRMWNGAAVVSRYDLEFFLLGGLIPLEVVNIGKPAPASDGNIYVSFQPTFPSPGVLYEARVTAIGPGGSVDSTASNAFSFTGSCTYVLSSSALSASAAGGPLSLNVLTSAGCVWTPSTASTWITVLTNGTSGAGAVSLDVAANASASARVGYVSVAGQTVTIAQTGAQGACTASALTTSVSASGAGLTGTLGVSAGAGCSWQASSPASWVTVSPASGSGAGTVSFTIAPNTSTTERSATLKVAGSSVVVNQAAAGSSTPGSTSGCAVPVKTSLSLGAAGGSGSIALTADQSCSWTATSPVAWATVSPASGDGPGSVTYALSANTGTASRTTTLMMGGSPVSVTQTGAAPGCTYAVSIPSASVAAAGGTGSVGVTTQAGCSWTASTSSSWVTLSPTSGTANGSVTYKATANTGTTTRVATLTIAGQVVMLSQGGASSTQCVQTVLTSNIAAPATASSGSIAMTLNGCGSWEASSPVSWVTLSPTSGGGPSATASYKIAANNSTASRTATLTVNGLPVTVAQAGASQCSYSVTPSSAVFGKYGGNGYVNVTTGSGCTWQWNSNASWIQLVTTTGLGDGSRRVDYKVSKNSSGTMRTGTMTIAGKTVKITQDK